MIGDLASFLSGAALLITSVLVMVAYRPSRGWFHTPHGTLGVAIFLGFLSAAANTAYWQVYGQIAVEFLGIITAEQLRSTGDWVDLAVKGSAATAAMLHLRALWLQLPEEERGHWRVWEMPWYPARRWCLVQVSRILTGVKDEK